MLYCFGVIPITKGAPMQQRELFADYGPTTRVRNVAMKTVADLVHKKIILQTLKRKST